MSSLAGTKAIEIAHKCKAYLVMGRHVTDTFVLVMISVDRVLIHSPKYFCWTSKSSCKPRLPSNELTTLNTNISEANRKTMRITSMSENDTIHACLAL